MDDFDFPDFEPVTRLPRCECGRGYCEAHGTWHLTDEEELLEVDRRYELQHGTRGGTRIIRKKLGGDK